MSRVDAISVPAALATDTELFRTYMQVSEACNHGRGRTYDGDQLEDVPDSEPGRHELFHYGSNLLAILRICGIAIVF